MIKKQLKYYFVHHQKYIQIDFNDNSYTLQPDISRATGFYCTIVGVYEEVAFISFGIRKHYDLIIQEITSKLYVNYDLQLSNIPHIWRQDVWFNELISPLNTCVIWENQQLKVTNHIREFEDHETLVQLISSCVNVLDFFIANDFAVIEEPHKLEERMALGCREYPSIICQNFYLGNEWRIYKNAINEHCLQYEMDSINSFIELFKNVNFVYIYSNNFCSRLTDENIDHVKFPEMYEQSCVPFYILSSDCLIMSTFEIQHLNLTLVYIREHIGECESQNRC